MKIVYGYGDSETWGRFAGHPNDPRNDDSGADLEDYISNELEEELAKKSGGEKLQEIFLEYGNCQELFELLNEIRSKGRCSDIHSKELLELLWSAEDKYIENEIEKRSKR